MHEIEARGMTEGWAVAGDAGNHSCPFLDLRLFLPLPGEPFIYDPFHERRQPCAVVEIARLPDGFGLRRVWVNRRADRLEAEFGL